MAKMVRYRYSFREHYNLEQQGDSADPVFVFSVPAESDMTLHAMTLRLPGKTLDAHKQAFDFLRVEIEVALPKLVEIEVALPKLTISMPAIGLAGPDPLFKFVQPVRVKSEVSVRVCGNPEGQLVCCILWFSNKKKL